MSISRNVHQRSNSNNRNKDALSRKKIKQMGRRFAEFQFVSFFKNSNKKKNQLINILYVVLMDGWEIMQVIKYLIIKKTLRELVRMKQKLFLWTH